MIPNLQDLPPVPPDEPSLLKRLIRPLLTGGVMAVLFGGLMWLYVRGIREVSRQETGLRQGLESIGADLWRSGKADEIRFMDDRLPAEIERLRSLVGLSPTIVVTPPGENAGKPNRTHELIYMKGNRPVLLVSLWVEEAEGLVDIVAFETGEEFGGGPREQERPVRPH